MGYFLVLFFLIFSGYSCSGKDILLKNHKLTGTSFTTPDFTLVITDFSHQYAYTYSSKIRKVNADLMTVKDLFFGHGFPYDGIRVAEILPPQTKFKVKQVYEYQPSFTESIFNGPHPFAVVEDNKGKQYTAFVFLDKIKFEENCYKKCSNWKYPLTTIMKSKTTKHKVRINYFLKDTKGNWIYFSVKEIKGKRIYGKNQLRPPYPKGMLKRSKDKLVDFLVQRKVAIIHEDKHHPYIVVQVDYLDYGNLMLQYEALGINSVSIVE